MEDVFYINNANDEVVTYKDLLEHVSIASKVSGAIVFTSTKQFFLDFITGLVNNLDLTLVDEGLENSINEEPQKNSRGSSITNVTELIEAVKKSTSNITLYTSGTTGQPKKVKHTIKTLTREVRTAKKHHDSIWGFAYNPTHMAGLQVFFQAFLNKNPMVDVFKNDKEAILNAINQYNITHISATPTFYRLLLPAKNNACSNVTNVSFGGEKSSQKLHQDIQTLFPNAKVLNIYASTEAGTLFSSSGENFKITEKNKGFVKIIDNELLIHNSLLGKRENSNNEDLWYATGDVVEQIDEFTFKFLSRKNEMINVGGYKVNPNEVEQYIDGIEGIQKSYVYGKPNPILGNILCAEIVLDNLNLTEPEIKAQLRQALKPYQVPRKIEIVKNIETTRTGKLKRTK